MPIFGRGGNGFDCLDNIATRCHFAKDAVTDSVPRICLVEKIIVGDIDEKLARSAIGHVCTSHCNRVLLIAQSIGRLVDDRSIGSLLIHIGGESTALDHKVGNDAMKDRAVVMSRAGVVQEVFNGLRGCLSVEFDRDAAFACLHNDAGSVAHRVTFRRVFGLKIGSTWDPNWIQLILGVQSALGFSSPAPPPCSFVFAESHRARARPATDARVSLIVERIVRDLFRKDPVPHLFFGPIRKRTDFHEVEFFVPADDRRFGSIGGLIPTDGAGPS
jgi:hypothetical protein